MKAKTTCEALTSLFQDIGMPYGISTDAAKNEVLSKTWKKFLESYPCKTHNSEANCQHQNRAERAWQTVSGQGAWALNRTDPRLHDRLIDDCYLHAVDVWNHLANSGLDWHTPYEVLYGVTPDISMFRFYFGQPVWFHDYTPASDRNNQDMHKGIFLRVAWSTGSLLTYKVLTKREKTFQSLDRSFVVPRNPKDKRWGDSLPITQSDSFPRQLETDSGPPQLMQGDVDMTAHQSDPPNLPQNLQAIGKVSLEGATPLGAMIPRDEMESSSTRTPTRRQNPQQVQEPPHIDVVRVPADLVINGAEPSTKRSRSKSRRKRKK